MAMQLYQGWPFDGTITDNLPLTTDEGIVAGMAIKKDATGKAIKAVGAADELIYFAMQDQTESSVAFSNALPVSCNNYILYTDQFVAASFAQDDKLEIGDTANEGKWMKHAGGAKPIAGRYDGTEQINNKEMIRIKKFN